METYGNEAVNAIKSTLSASIGCTNSYSGDVVYGAETRVAVRECLMHSAMRKETLMCDLLKKFMHGSVQIISTLYGIHECWVNTNATK